MSHRKPITPKQGAWLVGLIALAVALAAFVAWLPLPAAGADDDALTTPTAPTTGTTPTSGPIVLIDFQRVLDVAVAPRKALEAARLYHIAVLENPPSVEEQQMALMRLQRTKAKIDVYEAIVAALLDAPVLVLDDDELAALGDGRWVENPLNDGAWGAE